MLGGSSSINAMVYIRGNRADYDEWGIPGWSYDDLLPYFKRSEDNERGASEYHGAGGPLRVTEGRSKQHHVRRVRRRRRSRPAMPPTRISTAPTQDGFGLYQVTQRDGMRCSAAVAFLHPALERPNLTVETHMHVQRVLFEGQRAVGVVGQRLDEQIELRAEREVIVCGGAYNSPQLLQLSGVGPAELLTALGIEVVLDQPMVGQNLQDHPQSGVIFTTSEPVSLLIARRARRTRSSSSSRAAVR